MKIKPTSRSPKGESFWVVICEGFIIDLECIYKVKL